LLQIVRTWDTLPSEDQPSPRERERQFRNAYDKYYDQAEGRLLDERDDLKRALFKKKSERVLEKMTPRQQQEAEPVIRQLEQSLGR